MNIKPRPGCEIRCRACSHRDLSEDESVARKMRWLSTALSVWSDRLKPLVGVHGEERLGYREKTCLRASFEEGRWKVGLLAREQIVEIPDCPVHSDRVRRVARAVAETLPAPESGFSVAFVVVSGALLSLVLKARTLPLDREIVSWLGRLDPLALGLEGVLLNLNPACGQRVFSSRGWHKIWGKDRVEGSSGLIYGPQSFQQLIGGLYEKALSEAAEFLSARAHDSVLDFCSGTGASLALWRSSGARFLGVELSGESVDCARAILGPESCLQGRASERLPQFAEWLEKARDNRVLVFANPPRMGLESDVVHWIWETAQADRIAYLSCSAGTLARDLSVLENLGYAVSRITPYDFFPQTHHVEVLALLERRQSS